MSDTSQQDLDDVMDLARIEQKKQRALSQLLGELRAQADHHLVSHVRMGEVSSYLMSVTLTWVAERVGFAADLPIFRETIEGSKRIPIDQETVENIQQRQPDWRRQLQMATYMATRRHHKFPPLLLVGYQGWVYERKHEKWGTDGRAMDDSLTLKGLEPTETYWDLDDSDTKFYALDGQHRLMAIRGLRDLIQDGQLHALDEARNVRRGKGLTREEIIEHIHSGTGESTAAIHERLQRLMDERIGVEIVPAVLRGETYDDALRRLRQMFVDVNEHAKALTRSELTLLDETNGYRVVARRLLAEHSLLKSSPDDDQAKVDTTSTNLSEKSDCYTTLNTLAEVVRRYLKHNRLLPESANFASWDNLVAKGIYVRPEDSSLKQGKQDMIEYLDHLATLPSHVAFIQGKPASEIRGTEVGEEDNILFRPVAQTALAEALGKLATRGVTIKNAVDELARQELNDQLKLTPRTSPWFGVLSDPVSKRMRRHKKDEELCCRMFEYLLGGGITDDGDREKLRAAFALARQIDPDNKLAVNLEGRNVNRCDVRLPNPWR